MRGVPDRLPGGGDGFLRQRDGQRDGALPHECGNGLDEQCIRLFVLQGGEFNRVHLQLVELLGNLDLFLETQGIVDAMRLFAQCNIRKCNGLQHPYSFFVGK